YIFFFQAEDGIRDGHVTGVQTCALPICSSPERQLTAGILKPALSGARSPRLIGAGSPNTAPNGRPVSEWRWPAATTSNPGAEAPGAVPLGRHGHRTPASAGGSALSRDERPRL